MTVFTGKFLMLIRTSIYAVFDKSDLAIVVMFDAMEKRCGVGADGEWYGVSISSWWRVSGALEKICEHVVLLRQCFFVLRFDDVGDGILADEAGNESHLRIREVAI